MTWLPRSSRSAACGLRPRGLSFAGSLYSIGSCHHSPAFPRTCTHTQTYVQGQVYLSLFRHAYHTPYIVCTLQCHISFSIGHRLLWCSRLALVLDMYGRTS